MNIISKGSLKEHSFPKILADLDKVKATGTLAVATQAFKKNIYLKDGRVIFASSTVKDDRLGEMLVRAGKIGIRQYDESVELLKRTGKRQGAILVELGYITPKDLFWGVKYQVKEIIYSLFRLEEGTFEFNENMPPPDEVITLKMSTDSLIYEGVKKIDSLTRIRGELPDGDAILALAEDPQGISGKIDLPSQDKMILSLVDGKRPLKQLLEESRTNSFNAMKTFYAFLLIGLITEKRSRAESLRIEDILGSD